MVRLLVVQSHAVVYLSLDEKPSSPRRFFIQLSRYCAIILQTIFARKHFGNSLKIINCVFPASRKKSVDDLLTSSADVLNQAISLTTSSIKDGKLKRSPSPQPKKSHKRVESDASILSSEYVEVVSDTIMSINFLFSRRSFGSVITCNSRLPTALEWDSQVATHVNTANYSLRWRLIALAFNSRTRKLIKTFISRWKARSLVRCC